MSHRLSADPVSTSSLPGVNAMASETKVKSEPKSTQNARKRRAVPTEDASDALREEEGDPEEPSMSGPPLKKSRTNTPWTPAEEQRLKKMRDENKTWSEIAKTFPNRTEGSVKKHWYKDMHYAEFGEDESQALLAAIKDYESNKWKEIGRKLGKPAKACEQYAKDNFAGKT